MDGQKVSLLGSTELASRPEEEWERRKLSKLKGRTLQSQLFLEGCRIRLRPENCSAVARRKAEIVTSSHACRMTALSDCEGTGHRPDPTREKANRLAHKSRKKGPLCLHAELNRRCFPVRSTWTALIAELLSTCCYLLVSNVDRRPPRVGQSPSRAASRQRKKP